METSVNQIITIIAPNSSSRAHIWLWTQTTEEYTQFDSINTQIVRKCVCVRRSLLQSKQSICATTMRHTTEWLLFGSRFDYSRRCECRHFSRIQILRNGFNRFFFLATPVRRQEMLSMFKRKTGCQVRVKASEQISCTRNCQMSPWSLVEINDFN